MFARSRSLFVVLLEAGAIFASVLLAFWVEEWRDDRAALEQMEGALNSIRSELMENRAAIEPALEWHREVFPQMNELTAALADDGVFPEPGTIPETRHPVLLDVAYELSRETGALAPLETDTMVRIALAYRAVAQLDLTADQLSQRNAQIRYQDGIQYLSGRLFYFNDAINHGEEALIEIDQALAALEAREP